VKHQEIKTVFKNLEAQFSQKMSRVLIVGSDEGRRESILHVVEDSCTETWMSSTPSEAMLQLREKNFDCLVLDLSSPLKSCVELLELMTFEKMENPPTVVVYTGLNVNPENEKKLKMVSGHIILKRARSTERLFDEVTLVLHRNESKMSQAQRQMIKIVRNREQVFEGRKILLVDDDIRNIFALTSALEQKGATIVVGRNGHEALAKLNEDPLIDLVLMDIMMPEMDGYEATRQIRKQKRFSQLPIIAVTAKAMKDDQEKCLDAGTDDYVSKPVDLEKLLSLIRVWIPSTVMQ
jgi:CheY-like chemotaxis protein